MAGADAATAPDEKALAPFGREEYFTVEVEVRSVAGEVVAKHTLPSSSTVLDVKRVLHTKTGFPVHTQRLVPLGSGIEAESPQVAIALGNTALIAQSPCLHPGETELRGQWGPLLHLHLTLVVLPDDPELSCQLLFAAVNGNFEKAQEVLGAGADPDAIDAQGHTPVQHAARRGHLDVLKLLCDAGADQNKPTDFSRCNGGSPLHVAAASNRVKVARLLCASRASVDALNPLDGRTPLHVAARHGRTKVVQILCAALADVNRRSAHSSGGVTALVVASAHGNHEVVQHLLDAGADHNLPTAETECTPIFAAAARGQTEVVRLLCEARAEIDKATVDGTTPLCAAASQGHVGVVSLLCAAFGASYFPGQLPNSSNNALIIASALNHVEVVQALCRASVDPRGANGAGRTALEEATRRDHHEVVQALRGAAAAAAAAAGVALRRRSDAAST